MLSSCKDYTPITIFPAVLAILVRFCALVIAVQRSIDFRYFIFYRCNVFGKGALLWYVGLIGLWFIGNRVNYFLKRV